MNETHFELAELALRSPEATEKTLEGNLAEVFTGTPIYGAAQPLRGLKEHFLETVGWVYACAAAIADEVASIDLHLMRVKSTGEKEEVFEHPALDVLNRVNNFQTRYDFLWLTAVYLEIAGEAPWLLLRKGRTIDQMILIRPDKLEVNPGKGGELVGGYSFNAGQGEKLPIEPQDVVFLRYPDPKQPYRGMSTLAAAARTVDLDNYANDFNRAFFKNYATPSSVLSTDQSLTDPQRKALKKMIEEIYQGKDNAYKTAVLEKGIKWESVQLSQKDMDFLALLGFSRDKTLAIFRVPKTVLGITEDVNRANAEATDYVFSKRTIRPKMRRIVEQLNEFYLPNFPDAQRLLFTFTDPVPDDATARTARNQQRVQAGIITINEARTDEGFDSLGETGDRLLWPFSVQPVTVNPKKGKSLDPAKVNAYLQARLKRFPKETQLAESMRVPMINLAKRILYGKQKKVKVSKKALQPERKELFWNRFVKGAEQHEGPIKQLTQQLFDGQLQRILAKFPKKGFKALDVADVLLDSEAEGRLGAKLYSPAFQEILRSQGKLAFELLGLDEELSLDSPAVRKYLENHLYDFSFQISEETNRQVGAALGKGVEEGASIPALKKLLKEVFTEMESYRLDRIARTETINASNFATQESYRESGVVEQKEWLTAFDERTDDVCAGLNGTVVGLDEEFSGEGEFEDVSVPPIHPNCRCTIIPVIK